VIMPVTVRRAMNTPSIRSIRSEEAPAQLARHGDDVVYAVMRSGLFDGRQWLRGELIVCRPTPSRAQDGRVVLVPRGKGRPMLGHRRGGALWGPHGEPCSVGRWIVAGEVAGVWCRVRAAWAPGQTIHAERVPVRVAQRTVQRSVATRAVVSGAEQLALFATAA
jgi:hypothetical protein